MLCLISALAISERVKSDVRFASAVCAFQAFLSSTLTVLVKILSGFLNFPLLTRQLATAFGDTAQVGPELLLCFLPLSLFGVDQACRLECFMSAVVTLDIQDSLR